MERPLMRAAEMKSWKEVRLEIHPSLAEAASNFLIEQGSPGITQEDIKGLAGRKRERLIAYFPHNRSFKSIRRRVRIYLQAICKSHHTSFVMTSRTIHEEKWAEAWKENFKPIKLSPRLVIKPPWEKWAKEKDQIVIEIDPGMAFGTGTHPSTQMCLQFLEEIIPSFPKPPTILDVGTGSGILAIAARKMGVKKIVAVDIDPVAIDCARANARANCIGTGITFRVGSLDGLKRQFELVVANLLPQELLSVAPSLPKLVANRGYLILSGFLQRQKKEIANVLTKEDFEVADNRKLKGWASLVLKPGEMP
jgi:ribosomal protein L11 methyltransferase